MGSLAKGFWVSSQQWDMQPKRERYQQCRWEEINAFYEQVCTLLHINWCFQFTIFPLVLPSDWLCDWIWSVEMVCDHLLSPHQIIIIIIKYFMHVNSCISCLFQENNSQNLKLSKMCYHKHFYLNFQVFISSHPQSLKDSKCKEDKMQNKMS